MCLLMDFGGYIYLAAAHSPTVTIECNIKYGMIVHGWNIAYPSIFSGVKTGIESTTSGLIIAHFTTPLHIVA